MSTTGAPVRTPERNEVKAEHCWNLTELYKDDAQWEADLQKLAAMKPRIAGFRGTLGTSAQALEVMELIDRIYATERHEAPELFDDIRTVPPAGGRT